MTLRPTKFPEDLEFREAFTQTLLAHDFRVPLFTPFLNPWEEALTHAELLLHRRIFHVTADGGAPLARSRVLAIHPFHPVDPARFPFRWFRASPRAQFTTLYRDAVLSALMGPQASGARGWLPREVGDVNGAGPDWVGVVLVTPGSPTAWPESEVVRFTDAEPADLAAHPGRRVTIRAAGSVAALRLDAIAGLAHKPSRAQFKLLAENGGALLNYAPVTKGAVHVKAGDVVSLRGFPTVRITEIGEPNKKSRLWVQVESID